MSFQQFYFGPTHFSTSSSKMASRTQVEPFNDVMSPPTVKILQSSDVTGKNGDLFQVITQCSMPTVDKSGKVSVRTTRDKSIMVADADKISMPVNWIMSFGQHTLNCTNTYEKVQTLSAVKADMEKSMGMNSAPPPEKPADKPAMLS